MHALYYICIHTHTYMPAHSLIQDCQCGHSNLQSGRYRKGKEGLLDSGLTGETYIYRHTIQSCIYLNLVFMHAVNRCYQSMHSFILFGGINARRGRAKADRWKRRLLKMRFNDEISVPCNSCMHVRRQHNFRFNQLLFLGYIDGNDIFLGQAWCMQLQYWPGLHKLVLNEPWLLHHALLERLFACYLSFNVCTSTYLTTRNNTPPYLNAACVR
jgi:hypothetical protein